MKKLLFALTLAVLTFASQAAQFLNESLLNGEVTSLYVTNSIGGWTNLNSPFPHYATNRPMATGYSYTNHTAWLSQGTNIMPGYAVYLSATNPVGSTAYTNGSGKVVDSSQKANGVMIVYGDDLNPFRDVPIPQMPTPQPMFSYKAAGDAATNYSMYSLLYRIRGAGPGATNGLAFHLSALPDGVSEVNIGTNCSSQIVATFGVGAAGHTNDTVGVVPISSATFLNCQKIRVKDCYLLGAYQDAAQATNQGVYLLDLRLVGTQP